MLIFNQHALLVNTVAVYVYQLDKLKISMNLS